MKNRSLFLLLFSLLFFFQNPVNAAHLIGGHWHYDCLGGDDYRFTLTLFRDCGSTGALFDSDMNAPFDGTVSVFVGDGQDEFANIILSVPVVAPVFITPVCPDLFPCVEKGTYVFDLTLPQTSESVHLAYQRCCLAEDFLNLASSGSTGFTFTIEVTPEARAVCNNSPRCANGLTCSTPLDDFAIASSATDPDGDEMTFEFCAPLDGGGTDVNNFESPGGVAPNPDLPPPYEPVTFIAPMFTAEIPFGSSSTVELDTGTGILFGSVQLSGKYMYSTCINEFRDGVLLSRVRCTSQHLNAVPSPVFEVGKNSPLHLYPNPANENLTVDLPSGTAFFELEILDMSGRVMHSFSEVPSGVFDLETRDFPKGIYLLRAVRGDEVYFAKWVKK